MQSAGYKAAFGNRSQPFKWRKAIDTNKESLTIDNLQKILKEIFSGFPLW